VSLLAAGIGLSAGLIAFVLYNLIGLFTNLAFYRVWSFQFRSPEANQLGPWVIITPVIGGLIVGLMVKYGSPKIEGHGIPEAMEAVLTSRSRIEAKVAILKPLSAAIAIGTGGPFGAEGPIIQTGGAFGSLVGQNFHHGRRAQGAAGLRSRRRHGRDVQYAHRRRHPGNRAAPL
jgi:CIC family chloride channel protein